MTKHIDTAISAMTSRARILYGLGTLRVHGMPQASLQLSLLYQPLLPTCFMPPLLVSGALLMLATGRDWWVLRRAGKSGAR